MSVYRATYEVESRAPSQPVGAPEFVALLEASIRAYFEASILARSNEDDAGVHVVSSTPVAGPTGSTPVHYVVDHEIHARAGAVDAQRVQRRLEELLGIPQHEQTLLDIVKVAVEGPT